MTKKLRLIYQPYLIIAVSFIALYTFLDWLFFIKSTAFNVNEEVITLWLPLVLPWIPVFIWLGPRFKLLNINNKKKNLPLLYYIIAAGTIGLATHMVQDYVGSATGKLTTLPSISQISKQEKTKYYSLQNYYIDKKHIGVYDTADIGGEHDDEFNMHIYIAFPILDSAADTANVIACTNWIGCKYYKEISNRLSDSEKDAGFQQFANESQKDFDNKNFNQFQYLSRMGNSDDRIAYSRALKKSPEYTSAVNTIFASVDEPFANRNGNDLQWLYGILGIGSLILLIAILIPGYDEFELNKFENGNSSGNKEPNELLKLLVPREGYYITPILIDINVIVFLLMVCAGLGFMSFDPQDLIKWGGNYPPLTMAGQSWRLLTSIFVHGGFIHVLSNMYGLLFVGIFLEPRLGKKRYAIIYFVTGIIASTCSLYFHQHTVCIGASGAIFGLYGVFVALLLTKVFPAALSKGLLTSTAIFIGYNLLMGMQGNIDNSAHIGGLISGFIIGLILTPSLRRETLETDTTATTI